MKKYMLFIAIFPIVMISTGTYHLPINPQSIFEKKPSEKDFQTSHIEGCIQKIRNTTFLVNNEKSILRSDTISIEKKLIEGQRYRIAYKKISESNPPIIEITDYQRMAQHDCT